MGDAERRAVGSLDRALAWKTAVETSFGVKSTVTRCVAAWLSGRVAEISL
jgi:hypothetical protein